MLALHLTHPGMSFLQDPPGAVGSFSSPVRLGQGRTGVFCSFSLSLSLSLPLSLSLSQTSLWASCPCLCPCSRCSGPDPHLVLESAGAKVSIHCERARVA